MPETVTVRVNGKPVNVITGATAAVAILSSGNSSRTSVTGQARAPFCGMGTCFECRATINGRFYERSCQILCASGMEIETNGYTSASAF